MIRCEGEAADHRQEIAIAAAEIPAGVITFHEPEMQYSRRARGQPRKRYYYAQRGAKAAADVSLLVVK